MLATLARFCMSAAGAALAYVVGAIAALEAVRAGTGDEPSVLIKLAVGAAAFLVGAAVGYAACRRFVFGSSASHRRALPRYAVVVMLAALGHEFAFYLLLGHTPLTYLAALAMTVCATAIGVYAALRRWVFPAP